MREDDKSYCGGEIIPFITIDIAAQTKSILDDLDDKKINMIKTIIAKAKSKCSRLDGPIDGSLYQNFIKNMSEFFNYQTSFLLSLFSKIFGFNLSKFDF